MNEAKAHWQWQWERALRPESHNRNQQQQQNKSGSDTKVVYRIHTDRKEAMNLCAVVLCCLTPGVCVRVCVSRHNISSCYFCATAQDGLLCSQQITHDHTSNILQMHC